MIVQQATHNVTSIGAGVEHLARIKESPKAFMILSDNLYSDSRLAVIRELASNAWDAHIAAGRADVPFEVKLPTSWDNTFYVKDFGTGISEEDIYDMYMVFFDSTKTESDAFMGQLGLGCKSPYSYGATFTVESRQAGVKKTYSMYKNADLIPSVSLLDTSPTDEPDGLTVSLAVKADDIYKFQNAAKYALMYMPVAPKIIGMSDFAPHDVSYTEKHDVYGVRSTHSVYSGVRVVQGVVSYPVDVRMVAEAANVSFDPRLINLCDHMNLDLFVPIGKVQVAPSREALKYDLTTANNLATILMEVITNISKANQAEFDACGTRWDAVMLFNSKRVNMDHRRVFDGYQEVLGNHTFEGEELADQISLQAGGDESAPATIMLERITTSYRRNRKTVDVNTFQFGKSFENLVHIKPSNSIAIVVDLVSKSSQTRMRKLKAYLSSQSEHSSAYIITSSPGQQPTQSDIDAVIDLMGNPPVVMVDELKGTAPTTYAYKYKPKKLDELMVFQGLSYPKYGDVKFGPSSWETKQMDLAAGGYYMEIERYSPVSMPCARDDADRLFKLAKQLGLLDTDAVIVGLNSKNKDKVCAAGEWVEIFSHLKAKMVEYVQNANIASTLEAGEIAKFFGYSWCEGSPALSPSQLATIFKYWSVAFESTNNQPLLQLYKIWTDANKDTSNECDQISALARYLNVQLTYKSFTTIFNEMSKMLTDACAGSDVLKYVSVGSAVSDPEGNKLVAQLLTRA